MIFLCVWPIIYLGDVDDEEEEVVVVLFCLALMITYPLH